MKITHALTKVQVSGARVREVRKTARSAQHSKRTRATPAASQSFEAVEMSAILHDGSGPSVMG